MLRGAGDNQQLELTKAAEGLGDSLSLEFAHATRAELDRTIELQRVDGTIYRAAYPELRNGTWYVRLRPAGLDWELRGEVIVDDGLQTAMTGIEVVK